jgi:hypothetical protein
LVLPSELDPDQALGTHTRFLFPFNNAKKPPGEAFEEVRRGLDELKGETLVFLSHIETINWQVDGGGGGTVSRVRHSDHHLELLKRRKGWAPESSHFLRFAESVKSLATQQVAIAFGLDRLPGVEGFDPARTLRKQFRVTPVPGYVAVFFPAEKERSGLRFHLHAPFVPELSRASIKETPANQPLFEQLAALAPKALFVLRDLGLLGGEVLGALPNPVDDLPPRYQCIREAIVDAMNEHPLTPTYAKGHAPARHLLQARAALKSLLSAEDCEFLVEYEQVPPAWALGATQKNSEIDRFLAGLAITEWEVQEFVKVLTDRLDPFGRWDDEEKEWVDGPDRPFLAWLSTRPDEWHQKLYALLYRELEPEHKLYRLECLCLARLANGEYRLGRESYFPSEPGEKEEALPRVSMATYNSGKNKAEQRDARQLLEAIGVREVGEREEVEAILRERYSKEPALPDLVTYKKDLKRFIALVSEDPKTAEIFKEYWLFECADDKWYRVRDIYLDEPYLDTGLAAYFDAPGEQADKLPLAECVQQLGIGLKKLGQFIAAIGAITELGIEATTCSRNIHWRHLHSVPGERNRSPINRDYWIPGLVTLLGTQEMDAARLVWRTMCALPTQPDRLHACFRKNQANGSHYADSQLVHQLKKLTWVPQRDGRFVKPSDARRDLLPEGFAFDPGWAWIQAIKFGENAAKQSAEEQRRREVAKELGFEDVDALRDAKWFAALGEKERRRVIEEYRSRQTTDLPENEPGDSGRRAARVGAQALDAPGRLSEQRSRAVSVGREAVKKDTEPYLLQNYTNGDGETICQACKRALPFQLADGGYYFEAVEFLPELKRHHYQNYLALCPNHAAMFRHANGMSEMMKARFLKILGSELGVVLAGQDETLYFTSTHIVDLKAVIAADESDESDEGDPY